LREFFSEVQILEFFTLRQNGNSKNILDETLRCQTDKAAPLLAASKPATTATCAPVQRISRFNRPWYVAPTPSEYLYFRRTYTRSRAKCFAVSQTNGRAVEVATVSSHHQNARVFDVYAQNAPALGVFTNHLDFLSRTCSGVMSCSAIEKLENHGSTHAFD